MAMLVLMDIKNCLVTKFKIFILKLDFSCTLVVAFKLLARTIKTKKTMLYVNIFSDVQ